MMAEALNEQNVEAEKAAEFKKENPAAAADEAAAEDCQVVDLNRIPVPDEACYEPQAAVDARDEELAAKIDAIVEKNLNYHERLKLDAAEELRAEYAQMLRTKMQEKVLHDLDAACDSWMNEHNINTAADMLEIVAELLQLEKEAK